jgi:hypothetical protein
VPNGLTSIGASAPSMALGGGYLHDTPCGGCHGSFADSVGVAWPTATSTGDDQLPYGSFPIPSVRRAGVTGRTKTGKCVYNPLSLMNML